MLLGILLIIQSALAVSIGVMLQAIIFSLLPELFGLHIAFYIIAGLLIVWAVIDIVRTQKRRKRRILWGQLKKGLEIKSKLPPKTTKTSVKSSIYAGQLNLSKTSKQNKTRKKSGIYGGQSKKGAK